MVGLRSYLRRYWFTFGGLPLGHPASGLGCGVTAESRQAAESLLAEAVFKGGDVPSPAEVLEDVDVRDLDQLHVAPNMGDPAVRGVWFPLGF
jgi:hypothetical protein